EDIPMLARNRSIVGPVLVGALAISACDTPSSDEVSTDQAVVADPSATATIHGTVTSTGGGKIRILKLASESVFKVDPLKAAGLITGRICRHGGNLVDPHNTTAPDKHADDGKLVHFNRASVDGDSFSVEVPISLGTGLIQCGYTRSDETVLHFAALSEEGVRFRFDVPLHIGGALGETRVHVEMEADRKEPLAITTLDTDVALKFRSLPSEPKRLSGELSFGEVWQKIVATKRND